MSSDAPENADAIILSEHGAINVANRITNILDIIGHLQRIGSIKAIMRDLLGDAAAQEIFEKFDEYDEWSEWPDAEVLAEATACLCSYASEQTALLHLYLRRSGEKKGA